MNWTFLRENAAESVTGPKDMDRQLALLGNADDQTYLENYELGQDGWEMKEPDWDELTVDLMEYEAERNWKRPPKPRRK
jgi:hypothetical protein